MEARDRMEMKQRKEKHGSSLGEKAIIRDPRFARLHSDPRFQRVAKSKVKVPIDSRFQRMFWDKNFLDPLVVDKRGKRAKKKDKHLLNRYYRVEDEQPPDAVHSDQKDKESDLPVQGKDQQGNVVLKIRKDKINARRREEIISGKYALNGSSQSEQNKDNRIAEVKNGIAKKKGNSKSSLAKSKSSSAALKSELENTDYGKNAENRKNHAVKEESDYKKGNKFKKSRANKSEARVRVSSSVEENSTGKLQEDYGQSIGTQSRSAESTEAEDEGDEENEELPVDSHGFEDGSAAARKNSVWKGRQLDSGSASSAEETDVADSDSSSSSSDEDVEASEEEESDHEDEKVATTEEETGRLALVNMDWDHIKAVDLLMLMNSFLPKGGHVESVAIYPSQFGLQQMKSEEQHGPQGVFESNDEGDSDEENEVDMEKLRKYEKSKLRYYFAVVTCDSRATASSLYAACDGMEFERTSNVLDMRYVPDNMIFEATPRDTASEVPADYKVPEFETRALQHSYVKLTWDDEEPFRVKALRQKFSADQLNEMDFKDYLASEDDSESDHTCDADTKGEDDENVSETAALNNTNASQRKLQREKYRSLLLESTKNGKSKTSDKSDVDMEITFHSGLSDLSKRLLQQQKSKGHKDETVWEAYLRKKKEKKKAKKKEEFANTVEEMVADEQSDEVSEPEQDDFFQNEEDAFDDPFFNSDEENLATMTQAESIASKRSTGKEKSLSREGVTDRERRRKELQKTREEEEKSKAELELLLMDDDSLRTGVKGFNLKAKKLKGKRRGKNVDAEDKQADLHATADYDDPRFSSIFTSHHFAIDPTDPQFARLGSQLRAVAAKQQEKLSKLHALDQTASNQRGSLTASQDLEGDQKKRKLELSSLVSSLKRKVGADTGKRVRAQ